MSRLIPQPGQRVGWSETYTTANRIVALRTTWGTVIEVTDDVGGSLIFPMAGRYAKVLPADGRGAVYVNFIYIHTMEPYHEPD